MRGWPPPEVLTIVKPVSLEIDTAIRLSELGTINPCPTMLTEFPAPIPPIVIGVEPHPFKAS
jgi:hypothetical protein